MVNTTTKLIVEAIVTFLLTIAFLITSIRRCFWLLLTLPVAAVMGWKKHPRKKVVSLVAFALLLGVIYQPIVKLPSASFIGFSDQIEQHLDQISVRSNYPTTTPYNNIPERTVKISENYGQRFEFFGDNERTPVRPPNSTNEAIQTYFDARGAKYGNSFVTADIGAERMVDKFPFEPIPEPTGSFTIWTKPISKIGEHGQLPYPKHMLFILLGFGAYTFIASYLFSAVARRLFK